MYGIQISKRLEAVASFLPKEAYFADIGSDHAQLACFVCLKDEHARAIAGDINKGPFLRSQQIVKQYHLETVIDVRFGDGLTVIQCDPITELVIAGMGGSLIKSILETGKDQLRSVNRIIVQPNVGEINVRRWLIKHGFNIEHEIIIEENNRIYEIVVADRTNEQSIHLTEKELYFGPILLANKSKAFYKKWKARQEKLYDIMKQLNRSSQVDDQKLKQFQTELLWIKEVLRNETSQ